MKTREEIIDWLKGQGYTTIHEYKDEPGEFIDTHSHNLEEYLFVLKGSMEVVLESEHSVCREGDGLAIHANMMHSATVGPEGCDYIVGEKPA